MEVIGKIDCIGMSKNVVSYVWQFCRTYLRLPISEYESPTLGIEFSDCYFRLLFEELSSYHCKLIFYLINCNSSSSEISRPYLRVKHPNGRFSQFTPRKVDEESGPYEFLIPLVFLKYEEYRFSLQFKRHRDLTPAPEQSSQFQEYSLLLLEMEGHTKSSSLPVREESRNKPYLDNPKELIQDSKSIYDSVEIHTKSSSLPVREESGNKPYVDNPKELIQDLKSIYDSGKMWDFKIRIGENVLHAHKFMLCSRSPVFMRMMEHDCLESSSNSITISDCSEISFKKFLMYLYTGEIEDRSIDTVMPLYSLGDKYDVPALRNACSDILQNKLSESVDDVSKIVCDVLKLADIHNDMKLKDTAVSFVVKNFPLVSNTQSWKDLMNSDFKLTSEVLALVVTACQKLQT